MATANQTEQAAPSEADVFAKVTRRIIPLLFIGYVIAFLNRTNVGFAKLQMAEDLSLSDAAYGFGAGVFFLGYLLFEVPSNLVLHKVGARRWIARIMVSWGILAIGYSFFSSVPLDDISSGFTFTNAELVFSAFRFLLGAAEAGFYPGVIFYLTSWYPRERRSQAIALFVIAVPVTSVVGGPLNGAIMQFLDGSLGLRGWQWLFLAEGVPAIVIGCLIYLLLPDEPRHTRWLSTSERTLISSSLERDRLRAEATGLPAHRRLLEILPDSRVWILSAAYFCASMGGYAATFWGPTFLQESFPDADLLSLGFYFMIPYLFSTVGIIAWSRHSDRTGERRWHATVAVMIEAAGLVLLACGRHVPMLALIGLALVSLGVLSWLAIFWTFPTSFLSGAAAAGGIAAINSLGNLGGYFGPSLVGYLHGYGELSTTIGLLALALLAVISGCLTMRIAHKCG